MSKDITNKILDNFDTVDDLKQYASSQYSTIITQSKKIHELESKLEKLEERLLESERKEAVSSALNVEQPEGQSDTETACIIQIAMLKGLAMNRELTLEEVKKLEIFAKTLQMMRGKINTEDKKKEQPSKISTADLLRLVDGLSEQ